MLNRLFPIPEQERKIYKNPWKPLDKSKKIV